MSPPPEPGVSPTVRHLVDGAGLGLQAAPGTVGLDHRVAWVHTTELRDPSRYLRGGELVCTVGLGLTTDETCVAFADALARAGAAGMCFGVGDGHDDVPAALSARCAALGLPVIVAPPTVAFATVGRFVAEYRLGAEIASARTTASLVPDLIAALRRRDPVRRVLDHVGELTGGHLLLESDDTPPDADPPAVSAEVPGVGTLVWLGRGEQPARAVLALVARFVAAAQIEHDIEAALARERVGQLLSLVEGQLLAPEALAPLVGWDGLRADRLICSAWPAGVGALLAAAYPDALVGDAPQVCLMLDVTDPSGQTSAPEPATVPSGYAAPVGLAELGTAITQARTALGLAEAHGGSVGPDALSTWTSLVDQLPKAQLAPFVTQLAAPLAGQDRDRGTQHLRTLRVFLRTGCSLTDTARELFLHTNTVRHRLTRIHEITGRDPLRFDDQAAFAVALRAHDRA